LDAPRADLFADLETVFVARVAVGAADGDREEEGAMRGLLAPGGAEAAHERHVDEQVPVDAPVVREVRAPRVSAPFDADRIPPDNRRLELGEDARRCLQIVSVVDGPFEEGFASDADATAQAEA